MSATMSLLGLYKYDSTILDGILLPADVEKSVVINNLLRECAELEILYPQPETLKFFVAEWSKERLPIWSRLAETLKYEYDPISNYDRREEWTGADEEQRAEQSSGRNSGSRNGSSSGSSSGESASKTAGFNSADSDVPDKQQESCEENSAETSEESSAESSGETQSSASRTATRSGRAYGNIGVTTTQQMIEQERNISLFDIDHVIIDDFKKTFCLLIY